MRLWRNDIDYKSVGKVYALNDLAIDHESNDYFEALTNQYKYHS
ncbi:hypothetical protein [Granulicatella adiacens]